VTPQRGFRERPKTEYHEWLGLYLRHPNPAVRRWIPFAYSPFVDQDYPLPIDLLTEGMLVLAPTGSGKTSYLTDPLVASAAAHRVNVLSINFKESAASRENARIAAEEAGQEFQYLTIQEGYPSYCLNLVQNLVDGGTHGMESMLRGEIFMTGLGQNHGRGYGRSHYFNSGLLGCAVLLNPHRLRPGQQTFGHVARLLVEAKRLALPPIFEEAIRESGSDVLATCLSVAALNTLNAQKGIDPGSHLDLDRFCEAGSDLHLHLELPYGSRPEAAYLVGQTVIAKLSHALGHMPSTDRLTHLLVVEDAEPVFGPQFSQLLHVARSKGLGIVVSIQGRHQAATGTDDYWPSLQSYAAVKVLMGVEDTELFDYINQTAGRVRRARLSWRVPVQDDLDFGRLNPLARLPADCYPYESSSYYHPPYETVAVGMVEEARFEGNNEIMLACARGDMAFVRVRRNVDPWHHHGRTVPVRLKRHIDRNEYERRTAARPPALPGAVAVAGADVLADILAERGDRGQRVAETWRRTAGGRDDRGRPRAGEDR